MCTCLQEVCINTHDHVHTLLSQIRTCWECGFVFTCLTDQCHCDLERSRSSTSHNSVKPNEGYNLVAVSSLLGLWEKASIRPELIQKINLSLRPVQCHHDLGRWSRSASLARQWSSSFNYLPYIVWEEAYITVLLLLWPAENWKCNNYTP